MEESFDLGLQSYPIFEESYRAGLNQKIINHYYFREIGFETAGLFKNRLNQRMEEIMPYYNLLYKSALLDFDPLINNKYTETYTGHDNAKENETETNGRTINVDQTSDTTMDGTGKSDINENGSAENKSSSTGNTKSISSDTPQGMLSMEELGLGETYASAASLGGSTESGEATSTNTKEQNTTSEEHSDGHSTINTDTQDDFNSNRDRTNDFWKTFERKFEGLTGSSASKLLLEFRETFLNIDQMIINELADLFLNLY